MLIFGGILSMLGFLLCLTIIGAVIGIPLIVIGSIFMMMGLFGRRKTIITNIVTVQHGPAPPPVGAGADDRGRHAAGHGEDHPSRAALKSNLRIEVSVSNHRRVNGM